MSRQTFALSFLSIALIAAFSNSLLAGIPSPYRADYDKGYDFGYTLGYDSGFASGQTRGNTEGTANGWRDGFDKGWGEAYAPAYDAAYNVYYPVGHFDGWDQGTLDGFFEGYNYAPTFAAAILGNTQGSYGAAGMLSWSGGGDLSGIFISSGGWSSGATLIINTGAPDGYDWTTHYYDKGYDDGHEKGTTIGNKEGYWEAYPVAYSAAFDIAYVDGVAQGEETGILNGSEDGYGDGWDEGYDWGFDDGFTAGLQYAFYEDFDVPQYSPPQYQFTITPPTLWEPYVATPEPSAFALLACCGLIFGSRRSHSWLDCR